MIYSNQGYAIAGAMLEKLTGIPWETLMTERLFNPLHMDSAGFGPPGTHGGIDQPWGHVRDGSINKPSQLDNPPAIGPGGRVHCSLDDLARYAIFHLDRSPEGLLKPEILAKLHTPPKGGNYAFGWVVAERSWAGGDTLSHGGSNTMWYVVIWLAPEKHFSVVVATNVGGMADGQTAVGYVRKHAQEYGVNPDRIGIMGFSAGGTLTASVAYNYTPETRPSFVAPIYLQYEWTIKGTVPDDAPPMFILAATDDPLGLASHSIALYQDWTKARKSAELHLLAKGGHGFGMRKQNLPSDHWIERFADWLDGQGLLKK